MKLNKKILEKAAALTDYSPGQLLLLSALAGGGTYGGLRMLSEVMDKAKPQMPPRNAVPLDLPIEDPENQNAVPKIAAAPVLPPQPSPEAMGTTLGTDAMGANWLKSLLAIGVGVPAGFLGTKGVYDTVKGNQLDAETEEAKQKYLAELEALKMQNKMGSANTPHVDAFCTAIAEELEKAGAVEFNPAELNTFSHNPNVLDYLHKQRGYDVAKTVDNLVSGVSGGMSDTAKNTAGVVIPGTALAVLSGLIYMNNKKREKEENSAYPDKLVYGQ